MRARSVSQEREAKSCSQKNGRSHAGRRADRRGGLGRGVAGTGCEWNVSIAAGRAGGGDEGRRNFAWVTPTCSASSIDSTANRFKPSVRPPP